MPATELLNVIAKRLSIYKDKGETTEAWQNRIVYSAIGKLALASLWDSPDDENSELSVTAFTSKIKENARYYATVMNLDSPCLRDEAELAKKIYAIYKGVGVFYHRANWIYPSIFSSYTHGPVTLLRNGNPLQYHAMSGLGAYALDRLEPQKVYGSATDMFALHKKNLGKDVKKYISAADWKPVDEFPDGTEFLAHRRFRNGYWLKTPNGDVEVSLLRVPLAAGNTYYFYRKAETGWEWSQLPGWLTNPVLDNNEAKEWLALATGILMRDDAMPPIEVFKSDKLVKVALPYLLPPAEEAFCELYSWPMMNVDIDAFEQHYTRQMGAEVYPVFKNTMEKLGYQFKEVL